MSIGNFFANKVTELEFKELSSEMLHWAKVGILDTVGVTLAGANEPCATILSEVLTGSSGPAVVFGSNRSCSALDAALINGTASHALDFDDCNNKDRNLYRIHSTYSTAMAGTNIYLFWSTTAFCTFCI
jgi:2-methylcitrate dehydratase PrpD